MSFPCTRIKDMARHNIGDAQPRRRPLYHDIHAMKTRALIELERQREAVASNTALAEDTRRRRLTSLDLRSRQLDSLDATLDLSLTLIRQILALMRRPLLGADDTLAELDQMREQNAAILSLIQNAAVRAQRDNKQLSDMSVDLESRERNGDATDSTESTNGDPSNTPTHSLAEELLDDVFDSLSGTVAQFERDIADDSGHPFEEAQRSGHLETVVKLNGGDAMDDPRPSSGSDHAKNNLGPESTEASTLVDADNNHYVLTRTKDPTQHIEDTRLFHDVINIVSLSFLVGTTFELMGLPPFFGHIFAGIILGPSGLNWLQVRCARNR